MEKVLPGHTAVTGTGVPGATVSVEFADGTVETDKVDGDGNWSVPIPSGLEPGTEATAIQTEDGKLPSDPVAVPLPAQSAPPLVAHVLIGDTQVTGTGVPGAEVSVTFPDGTEKTTTVDLGDGTWSVPIPEGIEPGTEASAVQTEPGKLPSGPVAVPLPARSAEPGVNDVGPGDTAVTGTGVPGATITVTFPGAPEGTKETATVDGDGTWSVGIPEGIEPGTEATAVQTEDGKLPSDPVAVPLPEQSAAPTIGPVSPGDTQVTGTGEPGATVTVNVNGGTGQEAVVGPDGTWSVPVPGGLNPGDTVTATQTEDGKLPSEPATAQLPEQSVAPTINPVSPGDTQVTGTGVPGATISVTFPDGSVATATVGPDGTWSVPLPAGLQPGSTVSATQTEPNKLPSGPATQAVPALAQSPAPTINPAKPGDTQVTGTGVPGATVTVAINNGPGQKAVVGPDGTWAVPVPGGLKPGDTVTATQTEPGKRASAPVTKTVPALAQSPAPTINPAKPGDTQVTGTGVPGAKVTVTLPNGQTWTTIVGQDGTWKVFPRTALQPGDKVTAVQVEDGKSPSSEAAMTVPHPAESGKVEDTKVPGTGDLAPLYAVIGSLMLTIGGALVYLSRKARRRN